VSKRTGIVIPSGRKFIERLIDHVTWFFVSRVSILRVCHSLIWMIYFAVYECISFCNSCRRQRERDFLKMDSCATSPWELSTFLVFVMLQFFFIYIMPLSVCELIKTQIWRLQRYHFLICHIYFTHDFFVIIDTCYIHLLIVHRILYHLWSTVTSVWTVIGSWMDRLVKGGERHLFSGVTIEPSCDWSGFGMSTNPDRSNYCWNHRKKSILICTVERVKEQGYCSTRRKRTNVFSVLLTWPNLRRR